ncbi:MAG TPA: NUDIX hydrolase [Verrucomicrobiae bacterium]|nr:NUDIX hydrolase [Verrucomicrobiae bacterium]
MTREFTKQEKIAWLAAQPKKPLSSKLLVWDERRELLVIKPNYKKHWDIPGGMVEAWESPLEGAIREIKEELGLVIAPEALQFAGVRYGTSKVSQGDFLHFLFHTSITKPARDALQIDESEIEAYRWLPQEQAVAMLAGNHLRQFIAKVLQSQQPRYADGDDRLL